MKKQFVWWGDIDVMWSQVCVFEHSLAIIKHWNHLFHKTLFSALPVKRSGMRPRIISGALIVTINTHKNSY